MKKSKKFQMTDDIYQMVEDLRDASSMDEETGELWYALSSLWLDHRDYLSDNLVACLESEIKVNHEVLCTEYKIIEKTETITRKNTYLKYLG